MGLSGGAETKQKQNHKTPQYTSPAPPPPKGVARILDWGGSNQNYIGKDQTKVFTIRFRIIDWGEGAKFSWRPIQNGGGANQNWKNGDQN